MTNELAKTAFESELLRVEEHDSTVVIRFTNPANRNPLSVVLLERLDEILTDLFARSDVRAVIFTGSEDVFASGANLREIAALETESAVREFGLRGQRLVQNIADAPQLTIAAVNGFCMGGALDLALACQTRIAAPTAVFAHPGANLGIITGWGGTQRLPRLVGEAKASEMFLTARQITADEALRIGLINEIASDVLTRALKMADKKHFT